MLKHETRKRFNEKFGNETQPRNESGQFISSYKNISKNCAIGTVMETSSRLFFVSKTIKVQHGDFLRFLLTEDF